MKMISHQIGVDIFFKMWIGIFIKNPDVMIYGNDDSRSGWFDKKDLKNTTELIINREELPISGTMLRALMIQDKRREWMTFVNPKLHKMYDEIRSELMESIKEN